MAANPALSGRRSSKSSRRSRRSEPNRDIHEPRGHAPDSPPPGFNPKDHHAHNDDVDTMKQQMLKERLQKHVQRANTKAKNANEMDDEDINKLLHDDDLAETETPMDDQSKSKEDLTKIWEENMHDFVPEDFLTFEMTEGGSVMLMEKIQHHGESTKVRGTYYVVGGTAETKISCAVLDENMDVLFNHHNDIQGIILFDLPATDQPKEYSFLFTNETPGMRVVTFGLHTGEEKKTYNLPAWDMDDKQNLIDRPSELPEENAAIDTEPAEYKDDNGKVITDHHAADEDLINDRSLHLKQLYREAKQMKSECQNSLNRQYAHNENVSQNHSQVWYAMWIELVCFLAIIGFQVHHIKKSLDNKLVM